MKRFGFITMLILLVVLAGCTTTTELSTSNNTTTNQTTATTTTTHITTNPPTTSTTTVPPITQIALHTRDDWKDVNYVYSLSRVAHPLSEVVYNKFAAFEPRLTLDISTYDLTTFQKLVIAVSGDYNLKIILHSKDSLGVETTESGIIILTNEIMIYEFDLSGQSRAMFRSGLYQISLVVTPFANRHFGTFHIQSLTFEQSPLTKTAVNAPVEVPSTQIYNGTDESFAFNQGWVNTDYVYLIQEEETGVSVRYSKLSGQANSYIETKINGVFAAFPFINFTFQGLEGRTIKFIADPKIKQVGDHALEAVVTLTGELQHATLYLDSLSQAAINSIDSIRIVAEPGSMSVAVGSFHLTHAAFEQTALAPRPQEVISRYLGGGNSFSFNQYWQGFNGLSLLTSNELDGSLRVDYQKVASQGLLFTQVQGAFSDFNFLNFEIQANPNEEFILSFNNLYSYRSNQHVKADSQGRIRVTMVLGDLYFASDKNAIDMIRIQPNPNTETMTSFFIIKKAEFSNTPLVSYTPKTTIDFADWRQVGNIFNLDTQTKTISWNALEGVHRVTARMDGNYTISGSQYLYPVMEVEISTTTEKNITFEIDGARYQLLVSPSKTKYEIFFASPTSGNADYWKFSSGFNLWLNLDTTVEGSISIQSIVLKAFTPIVADTLNLIEKPFLPFNGLTMNASVVSGKAVVNSFTKTAFNSLVYFHITNLGGIVLSDFDYLNLIIESDNVSEFLIELSGRGVMMHYVTLKDGRIELTMTLSSLLLPSSLNTLQYINITPMPNSNSATGSFSIVKAEFSTVPMIEYDSKTQVTVTDWKELATNFTVNPSTNQITWNAQSGSKSLFTRMYGDYSNLKKMTLNISVLQEVVIEFEIIGARYRVTAIPGQSVYVIDLRTPTSGNADPWKFDTGFNLVMWITTTVGGSITFNQLTFEPWT